MRKINPAAIPDNISLFRHNVLEAILCHNTILSKIDYDANNYLRRLFPLTKRRTELDSLCAQIGKTEWNEILAIYVVQTRTIKKDPFALIEHSFSPALSGVVEILYDTLFDPDYWIGMGLPPFSRMIFKEHFYKNHSWWVCPYCDMAKDLENASFEVDHLLPKSRFPLLGINEWNLIPICPACNSMHTGKGDNTISQYRNLFTQRIGDLIRFSGSSPFRVGKS